jgi:hypothetical protein
MGNTVPNWIERLLGINAEAGEGTSWGIETAWILPPWATLLLALFALVFVAVIYRREGRPKENSPIFAGAKIGTGPRTLLAVLRLGLIAIVLLMIAQVTLTLKRTGLPYVAVVIDDSLSMSIVDDYPKNTRKEMIERLKESGLEKTDASPHPSPLRAPTEGWSGEGTMELNRWNLARSLLIDQGGEWLQGIAEGHKLRVFFLTGVRPSRRQDVQGILTELRPLAPKGESTRLGAGLRAVLDELRGATPAAIVTLTDGINTDGPPLSEAADSARRRGVPLFFVGLGSDRPANDLKLSDLLVDDVVFVDDVVNFECKLTASGFEGRPVTIALREKGKSEVLAKIQAIAGPDGQPRQVRLPYRPTKVGQFEYVVEAETLPGELQKENNRQSRIVQVRKEKIRVLLVQAAPSFEYRYLRNMLQRDETISLHTVLQDADLEHADQDASTLRAFPQRRDELFAYDVVILGDANPALLSAAAIQNLADFVDQPAKGGSLVMIAGPAFMPAAYRDTPLARLFPFSIPSVRSPDPEETISEGFSVRPTDLGLASPALQLGDAPEETEKIWRGLPPMYWLLEIPEVKPGVRVLAEAGSRAARDGRRLPVICFQYVGAGKVLFHSVNETWRWRYRVGDKYFARYWIQTIRYLCRSKLSDAGRAVTLTSDRREYALGDSVRLRVRFADERQAPAEDDGVTVSVEQSGRKTQRLQLQRAAEGRGVFEGVLDRPGLGNYHAWLSKPTIEGQSPSADFAVAPPAGEFAQTRMDAAEMRRAAELSGGKFYTWESADQLLDDLPPGRQVPIESLPPRPLWNRWPVLALFLGLIVAEWILRKRRGMV